MLHYVKGKLTTKQPMQVVLETGGMGYEVVVPLSTYSQLPDVGVETTLLTHLHIREDAWHIFGFYSEEEKELFKLLIAVSGIGPKLAITILSGIGIPNFKSAIVSRDTAQLTAISGVGKKTAERIIVELKEKIVLNEKDAGDLASPFNNTDDLLVEDSVIALVALGYKKVDAREAIKKVLGKKVLPEVTVEGLIRGALQYI